MPSANDILKRVFGYDGFRAPQDRVIETVLAGQDCFVLMPTGSGKSLCYQIPAMIRPGTGIVVSPLISLMKDQVDALRQNGVSADCFHSGLEPAQAAAVVGALKNGRLDLLYVSPERANHPEFQAILGTVNVALFAIDEAHCVSQWGHDFRPDYVRLGDLRPKFAHVPWIALTATADAQTREDVLLRLRLIQPQVFSLGFDRPNIRYSVVEKSKPELQLRDFVGQRPGQSGIVYCLSRKRVEQVTQALQEARIRAKAYHAGLESAERTRVQDEFQRDDVDVVVATVAFGMGIDKPDVRFVVHYDLPKSVEAYYQETGRAGRDGLPAEALLLYSAGDVVGVRKLIESGGNEEQKRIELRKLRSIAEIAEATACRRRLLLAYFGESRTGDCGNCDICLNPPDRFDATEDAKLALMTVYRLRQRFGMGHVVDVLRGSESAKIQSFGHDAIETHGKGRHRSAEQWMSLLRQLVHLGLLVQDQQAFNVLKLTPATRGVLREGERVFLVEIRDKVAKPKPKTKADRGAERDSEGFKKLRGLRRTIADEEGIPPFMVLTDQTLRNLLAAMPRTPEEMLRVSGIGEAKVNRYGARFLAALEDLPTPNSVG